MKITYTLLFSLFVSTTISTLTAQVEKTIYQSLMVSDSTMQIEFDIPDPHEVIPWHHEGRVMIEVSARLDGSNMDVLKILINEGRYTLVSDNLFPVTTMHFKHTNRPAIKTAQGESCKETVTIRIYIPEGFVLKKNVEPKLPIEQPTVAKTEKRN